MPLSSALPVLDQHDAVGEAQGGAPVGDEHGRASGHELAQGRVDLLLGAGVDRRRRVVEHEHVRIGEHGAGDRDALPLAAREREPALADDGVVPVGELGDEVVRAGHGGRAADVVVGGVGAAVRDVGPHGVGEEERVLEHDADLVADGVEGGVAHVDAVDADAPLLHVVEAREQQAHGRLARAGRTDERHRLARCDAQREVAQHRFRPQVPVGDVVELDLGVADREAAGRRGAR